MIIPTSNTVNLLSSPENSQAIPAGLPGEATSVAAFSSNFFQQLAHLQNNALNNTSIGLDLLSGLQTQNKLTDSNAIEQDLQNFAALFGKSVPAANKLDQGINLDDTLSALTDVLQYLQNLKSDTTAANQTQQSNNPANFTNPSELLQNDQASSVSEETVSSNNTGSNLSTKNKTATNEGTDLALAMIISGQALQPLSVQQPLSSIDTTAGNNLTTDIAQNQQLPQNSQSQAELLLNEMQKQLNALSLAQSQTQTANTLQTTSTAQSANSQLQSFISQTLAAMSGSMNVSANQLNQTNQSNGAFKKPLIADNTLSNISQAASVQSWADKSNPNHVDAFLPSPQATDASIASAITTPVVNMQTESDQEFAALIQSDNQNKALSGMDNTGNFAVNLHQPNQPLNSANPIELPAMNVPLNHPNWNAELADKLQLMHQHSMPSAELQINPQHLGPISIKIDMSQDQTSISFTTQHAQVKEAIEASIPKLREMLGEQQLNLLDVNVSQQQSEQKSAQSFFQMTSDQNNRNQSDPNYDNENSTNQAVIDKVETSETGQNTVNNGLLNLFA